MDTLHKQVKMMVFHFKIACFIIHQQYVIYQKASYQLSAKARMVIMYKAMDCFHGKSFCPVMQKSLQSNHAAYMVLLYLH